jgi:hypothetical protein
MQVERTALVVFAAAILFSMVREWNAPVVCSRPPYSSTAPHLRHRSVPLRSEAGSVNP